MIDNDCVLNFTSTNVLLMQNMLLGKSHNISFQISYKILVQVRKL